MNESNMKKQLLITALLLMPATWLHAQENKHAQAMRTAFVETIYGIFPKNINAKLKSYNEDSITVAWGEWGCLDGGGLVPKEKIHVVKLSQTKSNVTASIGPLYIDGHRFSFNQVPDDPTLPLRPMLEAFDLPRASVLPAVLTGLVIMTLITAGNVIAIRRKVASLWLN